MTTKLPKLAAPDAVLHLRDYQYDDLLRLTADFYRIMAIVYGVGGGKTVESLATASILLEMNPTLGIIVAVSQLPIGVQFIDSGGGAFKFEGGIHQFPRSFTSRRCANRKEVGSYLSTQGNQDQRMAVTTYSALLGCELMLRQALASGRPLLMIIDEGHHAPEIDEEKPPTSTQKLAQLVARLSKEFSNLHLMKLTGTPYRTDNMQVIDTEGVVCSKRIIELMHEGYAPSTVLTDAVPLPADTDGAIDGIVQKWLEDGRPSAVVRVKSGLAVVPPLVAAFQSVGASVVNTTGDHGGAALIAAVRLDEKGQLARGTVFITMVRMIEGINVKTLTHAYFWGVPQSMTIVEQLLGRIMRLRIVGSRLDPDNVLPIPHVLPEWAMQSKVTFFFQEADDADVTVDHVRLLLRATLFLSTFSNPSWVIKQLSGIRDGVPVFRKPSEPVEFSDQRLLAYALEVVQNFEALEWRPRAHPESRIGLATHPDLFAPCIYRWYQANPGLRMADDPELGLQDIHEALHHRKRAVEAQAVPAGPRKARQRRQTADDDLVNDVVNDNVEEFHEATFDGLHYGLRSATVNYWAERLNQDLLERIDGQPKTVEEVFARVIRFYRRTGRLPLFDDEDDVPRRPVPFRRYHQMLRSKGHRGLYPFVALRQDKDVAAQIRRLTVLTSRPDFLELSRKEGEKRVMHNKSATGYYFPKALLVAGRCGIQCPPDIDPFDFLELLEAVDSAYPSRKKLEPVEAVYRDEGLDGVRDLIEENAKARVA